MKPKLFKLILSVSCIFLTITTYAQTITGKVRSSADNSPIVGASVKISGTETGTITDANGNFSVNASSSSKLSISSIGFETMTISLNGRTSLSVSLRSLESNLEDVIVSVGSRNSKRSLTDTPLPVDILSNSDLKSTGQVTFDKALQYRVPSFNTVQTPVNDATALLDPYELRNMGPSRTLILINGKRKNLSSLVYIQTSPGRGETGADLSAIPTDAIKRVEILRDGASAQYGSDAISGVMNIILKDRFQYGSASLNLGVTSKGDGQTVGFNVNNGANFGSKGYINYNLAFQKVSLASRSGIVDANGEASDFGASLATVNSFLAKKPDAGNINGSPENTSAKFLVNAGIPLDDGNSEVYFNTAYVYKKVNSYANYRTPYWRPTDYGLLTPSGQPYIGYQPTFEGDLNDYNGTLGFRSDKNGWKSDLSLTVGGNRQLYTVNNSVNRSLGTASPISFRPGGYSFSHQVGNIDLSKAVSNDFTISFGSEFRAENYQIFKGDTASYVGTGTDSYSGTPEPNALKATRSNFGGYVDLAYDISKQFLINGTMRLENYSDFGNAFVWKISSRYKTANNKLTFRSSVSTGFRAPSLHQIYTQTTKYGFVPGSGIQISGLVNNTSSQARLLGVPKLDAEKSVNFTIGLGANPSKDFNISLDYYNITLKNRIILSSEIGPMGTPQSAALDALLAANGIVSVSFFTNGIDTKTEGLDLVANYRNVNAGSGKMHFSFAGNFQFQNVRTGNISTPALIKNSGQSVFDFTQESLLLASRPKFKHIFGVEYEVGKWSINLNNTVFGPTTFRNAGLDQNLKVEFKTKIVTDLGFTFNASNKTTLSLNISNLLNVLPEWKLVALNSTGQTLLANATQVKQQENYITFNNRYPITTYDGSHFSQLGTIFNANITVRF